MTVSETRHSYSLRLRGQHHQGHQHTNLPSPSLCAVQRGGDLSVSPSQDGRWFELHRPSTGSANRLQSDSMTHGKTCLDLSGDFSFWNSA